MRPDPTHLEAYSNQDTIIQMNSLSTNQETRAADQTRRAFGVSRLADIADHFVSK